MDVVEGSRCGQALRGKSFLFRPRSTLNTAAPALVRPPFTMPALVDSIVQAAEMEELVSTINVAVPVRRDISPLVPIARLCN